MRRISSNREIDKVVKASWLIGVYRGKWDIVYLKDLLLNILLTTYMMAFVYNGNCLPRDVVVSQAVTFVSHLGTGNTSLSFCRSHKTSSHHPSLWPTT